mmetsp:Transcript_39518/g.45015  ORF Transcript_39518/g.45015 Transcript_39518/m.45015 type:complete len:264 (-) Transcript_39518:43-834(-)
MFLFSVRGLLTVATLGTAANCFFCASKISRQMTPVYSLPSAEESARTLLSEYMVKSHVEKLKAVKIVEEQKQAEIEKLKIRLNDLEKAGSNLTTATTESQPKAKPTEDSTVEALQEKLKLYQNFIAKYTVESQEAKYNAVRDTESAIAAKFDKTLQQKLGVYQNFIARYTVDAQEAKFNAVREAEAAVAAKYEARISSMIKDAKEETKNSNGVANEVIDSELQKISKELKTSVEKKGEEASMEKEFAVVAKKSQIEKYDEKEF